MQFTYWSNKISWHDNKILVVNASTLSEADKIFLKETGLDPVKLNWISVTLEKKNEDSNHI